MQPTDDVVVRGAVDFTSANYLGYRHAWSDLRPWHRLTTGRPALLDPPSHARDVAAGLASTMGCEAAILARSTIHAMLDIASAWSPPRYAVVVDAAAYPTTFAGLAGSGAHKLTSVPHFDIDRLELTCRRLSTHGRRPIVVMDGSCPGCGRLAPLHEIIEIVRSSDGLAVIDDTQAIGLLGRPAATPLGWGHGGGGTACSEGILPGAADHLIVVASLAKSYSAPLTVIAGAAPIVDRVKRSGPSRMHSSPPSSADLAAVRRVLRDLPGIGERRRAVERLVDRFRNGLRRTDVPMTGSVLPFQLVPTDRQSIGDVDELLRRRSLVAPIVRLRCRAGLAIGICLRADHCPGDVDRLVQALADGHRRLYRAA